jgi:hypothetical protein
MIGIGGTRDRRGACIQVCEKVGHGGMATQRRQHLIDLSHEAAVHEATLCATPQPPHRLVMGTDR